MKYNNEELQALTEQWSNDRGILDNGKITTQCLKLMEELGEAGVPSANIGEILDESVGITLT